MHRNTKRAVERLCEQNDIDPGDVVAVFRLPAKSYIFNPGHMAIEVGHVLLNDGSPQRYLQPGIYVTWRVQYPDRKSLFTAGPGYNTYWDSGPDFTPDELQSLAENGWLELIDI